MLQRFQVFIQRLVVDAIHPISVQYLLVDKQKLNMLNLEHFLTDGVVGLDTEHQGVLKEYQQVMKIYISMASELDLVRLRQFLVTEVQRILQERLEKYGKDIFAKEVVL